MSATFAAAPMNADDLTKLIKEHMDSMPMAQGLGGDAKTVFCKDWPTVKPVLAALGGLLSAIPGVGVFAGPAIAVVTTAGDAASRALCGAH